MFPGGWKQTLTLAAFFHISVPDNLKCRVYELNLLNLKWIDFYLFILVFFFLSFILGFIYLCLYMLPVHLLNLYSRNCKDQIYS